MAEQSRRRNRKKEEVDSAEEVAQEPDKDTKGETPAEEEAEEPDPLVLARNEAEDYKDRWIRLAAEFDNYKKRTAREFQAVVRSASERVIRDLLPVLDAFDRAINLDDEARGNPDSYQEGVRLMQEQMANVLQREGLSEMVPVGEPFDPNYHDALMQIDSAEHEAGVVAEVVEKGYRLEERVLRPAKVVVSRGKAGEASTPDDV